MPAIDKFKEILRYYGLESLAEVLSTEIKGDVTIAESSARMLFALRDTTEYKTRFKGNEARVKAGLSELNAADYVGQENAYRQVLASNSLPKGFYDTQEDFNKFIGGDVSPQELHARVAQGYNAVMQAEPGTKAELKQLYGLSESDIAAYFIDPVKFSQSDAIKKANAAIVASEARRQAGIGLNVTTAEMLATEGVNRSQAQQGFAEIGTSQELYGTTTAEASTGQQAISQEQQISGTFGTNAEARKAIAARKRSRQAKFEQGGGFAASQTGTTALGTAG